MNARTIRIASAGLLALSVSGCAGYELPWMSEPEPTTQAIAPVRTVAPAAPATQAPTATPAATPVETPFQRRHNPFHDDDDDGGWG